MYLHCTNLCDYYIFFNTQEPDCMNYNIISVPRYYSHEGGICTSLIQYVIDSNMLTWENPNCRGWENALDHYNLKIEPTSGVYEYMTSDSSFMIPAHINGIIFTTVIAENVCGEKTVLNTASLPLVSNSMHVCK